VSESRSRHTRKLDPMHALYVVDSISVLGRLLFVGLPRYQSNNEV
jgi:hypothetical protein